MKRPARFTEAELTRALRALDKAGVRAAIEVTAEGLRIVPLEAPTEEKRSRVAPSREIVL